MASFKSKDNWNDIFSTPKHSRQSKVDKEGMGVSEDDSFSRFAKQLKQKGAYPNYKLGNDTISVDHGDGFFIRILKKIRNVIVDW